MTVKFGVAAREIVQGIRSDEFTAVDVAGAHLQRVKQVDGDIQAFATVNPELVRQDAAVLDTLHRAGASLPLHGVPVGVKDIIDVAGLPTIAGFEPYRDRIAQRDAGIVARLKSLGALVLGKTHTTQFAVGDPAPTRNPWDQTKSPAGSSAGSGAAVPAGMVPIALGSQTAGSMLRPAAFNGSVGMKPTYGWMPLDGVIPLCWSLDHLGLYAGSVEDVALVYGALTDTRVESVPAPSSPRFALLTSFLEMSDPAVASHLRDIADILTEAGAIVEETELPVSFDDLFAVHQVIFGAEMAAVHSANLARYRDDYGAKIRAGVEVGSLIPASYLLHAQRLQRQHIELVDNWMSRYDALLLPTVSTEACDIAETGDRRFQVPATLLGLPALSLPTGLGPNGLPLGTQLIGRAGADASLLLIAEWLVEQVPLIGKPSLGGSK
jgi:aspartyl-tRNA(Asn)/glutamyl-tRNA(Gln) amidotransferase subunit A